MNYQVLARKWRPRTFADLVGQEHVVRTLTNALTHNRLHHAFLFTGTRGVGKTTLSRILAKSLNCEQGVSATPCGVCSACREIDEGRFVDLLEVDAASRTKVEDTRELLENVQYAPTRGRYKVYLIDEVHMLSNHSFNALLKTLEEPPPHVKFLLATTDPQKLPITVLSRCLKFNLRRLSNTLISERLEIILQRENITYERPALALLAQAGEGSMRDALSLLDQAIAYDSSSVNLDAVSAMLGTIDQRQVLGLLEALAAQDAALVLARVAELDQIAPDYAAVLAELITLLQRIALLQVVPSAATDTDAPLIPLAAALTPQDVQLFYQIALHGRRDLPLSPDPRGGFEMTLLRMLCFYPLELAEPATTTALAPAPERAAPAKVSSIQQPSLTVVPATGGHEAADSDWSALVARLNLSGMAQELARNCTLHERRGEVFHLIIAPGKATLRNFQDKLEKALQEQLGPNVRVHIQTGTATQATPAQQVADQQRARQRAAEETIQNDSNVQALQTTFNAKIKPDSVTPLDD